MNSIIDTYINKITLISKREEFIRFINTYKDEITKDNIDSIFNKYLITTANFNNLYNRDNLSNIEVSIINFYNELDEDSKYIYEKFIIDTTYLNKKNNLSYLDIVISKITKDNFLKYLINKNNLEELFLLKELHKYLESPYKEYIEFYKYLESYNIKDILKYYREFINSSKLINKDNFINEFTKYLFTNGYLDTLNKVSILKENLSQLQIKLINYSTTIKIDKDKELFIKYINNSLDKLNLTVDNYELMITIFERITTSNSHSLSNLKEQILNVLINTPNPLELLNKIESIFVNNNLPEFVKIYLIFKILYPTLSKEENLEERFNFTTNSKISPYLKDNYLVNVLKYDKDPIITKYFKTFTKLNKDNVIDIMNNDYNLFKEELNKIRFILIFNDLFRISISSNSYSLINYLNTIEVGNDLYLGIKNNTISIDNLSNELLSLLYRYSTYLETIYNILYNNKIDNLSNNTIDRLSILYDKFKITSRYDLPDRIVRCIFGISGIKSFKELKDLIHNRLDKLSLLHTSKDNYIIEENDYIRGIGSYKELINSLDKGNICKEYLSSIVGSSESDITPLDIDFTKISKDNLRDSLTKMIDSTQAGFYYGNIFLVIKHNNKDIYLTRDNDREIDRIYNPFKLDLFSIGKEHFGIRTGISINEADYILVFTESNYEISLIKMELAKKGLYIPLVNKDSVNIFSYEEYLSLRDKVSGISLYGIPNFKFSNNLSIPSVFFGEDLILFDKKNKEIEDVLRDRITKFIKDELGISEVYDYVRGDISKGSVDLIGTGSTFRKTATSHSADYDFILRVDKDIACKASLIRSKLYSYFNTEEVGPKVENRFRGKGLIIPGIDMPIDLDISLDQKKLTDTLYTTDAILEKLKAIKNTSSEMYDLVRMNIIYAKMLFKENDCYKKGVGLGGVGVENFILQNGGSLYDAALSFYYASTNMETMEAVDYDEFINRYQIWDLGENFEGVNDLNDEFIRKSLSRNGYQKMRNCLITFIQKYNLTKDLDNGLQR